MLFGLSVLVSVILLLVVFMLLDSTKWQKFISVVFVVSLLVPDPLLYLDEIILGLILISNFPPIVGVISVLDYLLLLLRYQLIQ